VVGRRGGRWTAVALCLPLALGACGTATGSPTVPGPSATPGSPSATARAAPTASASPTSPTYALGRFPAFPTGALPASTEARLQAVLDAVVADGSFAGITASVIVADRGSWAGAAGTSDGEPLTTASRAPTHSSAKTIVAAQVMRYVESGKLGLDARAADYLPPSLAFVDGNDATIRQVLGMRSGIPDLHEDEGYYPAEQAVTIEDVFRMLPPAETAPGTVLHYASTNYVLLGAIIEHLSGQPLADALRSGVLDRPGLEGIVYTVDGALAGDGWGVESTSASLARWAYELYGGFVVSTTSLDEMIDFRGQWYGLGTFDFSSILGRRAVGHEGESSVTTCCSVIEVAALPDQGIVIAVQADTGDNLTDRDFFAALTAVSRALRDAART
jgi:CubicO group peptidase (beta-lactamase class C family)